MGKILNLKKFDVEFDRHLKKGEFQSTVDGEKELVRTNKKSSPWGILKVLMGSTAINSADDQDEETVHKNVEETVNDVHTVWGKMGYMLIKKPVLVIGGIIVAGGSALATYFTMKKKVKKAEKERDAAKRSSNSWGWHRRRK